MDTETIQYPPGSTNTFRNAPPPIPYLPHLLIQSPLHTQKENLYLAPPAHHINLHRHPTTMLSLLPSLLTLLLSSTTLAQPAPSPSIPTTHIYVCTDPLWLGRCTNFELQVSQCCIYSPSTPPSCVHKYIKGILTEY